VWKSDKPEAFWCSQFAHGFLSYNKSMLWGILLMSSTIKSIPIGLMLNIWPLCATESVVCVYVNNSQGVMLNFNAIIWRYALTSKGARVSQTSVPRHFTLPLPHSGILVYALR